MGNGASAVNAHARGDRGAPCGDCVNRTLLILRAVRSSDSTGCSLIGPDVISGVGVPKDPRLGASGVPGGAGLDATGDE